MEKAGYPPCRAYPRQGAGYWIGQGLIRLLKTTKTMTARMMSTGSTSCPSSTSCGFMLRGRRLRRGIQRAGGVLGLLGERGGPVLFPGRRRDHEDDSDHDPGDEYQAHPDRHCYHDAVHDWPPAPRRRRRDRRVPLYQPAEKLCGPLLSGPWPASWPHHPACWTELSHWSSLTGMTCSAVTEQLDHPNLSAI